MIFTILFSFFIAAFVGGNICSFSLGNGVRIALLDFAVVFIVGYFFLTYHDRLQPLRRYLYVFGPFISIALMSLLFQVNRFSQSELAIASLYLWRFIAYSLLTVVAAHNKELKKYGYQALWVSGVMIGILGLVQYFLYPNLRNLSYLGWDPHEFRIFSTFLDPNFTGVILVLTLIFTADMLQHKNTLLRIFVLSASGMVFLALILTYSRGSYVAFIVACVVWAILKKRGKQVSVIVLLFVVLLFWLPHPGGEGVNLLRSLSVYSRIKDSKEAIQVFLRHPFLGVGFNTLRFVREKTEIDSGTIDVSHSGAGFHNSWLFILATTGIFGFIAYGITWRNIFMNTKEKEMLIISFIAVGVHSFFDNSLFYPWVMVWLWLLVGIVLKADRVPSVPT